MSLSSSGIALIADAMLRHINAWPDKPAPVKLMLDKKAVSMMMQPLAGTKVLQEFITGSFRGQWPFALYIRVSGEDTASRLDAMRCLNDAAYWLETSPMPVLDENIIAEKIYSDLPAMAARFDDGTEDYQIILRLTFYQKA